MWVLRKEPGFSARAAIFPATLREFLTLFAVVPVGGLKHSAPVIGGQDAITLTLLCSLLGLPVVALRRSCTYRLVLFIICSFPSRLTLLLVCPASRLRAAVQGMRPSGFRLLCLKLRLQIQQRPRVTIVGMRTFLASLADVHP